MAKVRLWPAASGKIVLRAPDEVQTMVSSASTWKVLDVRTQTRSSPALKATSMSPVGAWVLAVSSSG